ncbi:VPLPA-CTERM sorting domain-containing protein [Dongia rigui]|uniref:VPLPA-CTERM sorting domain-containing protein n=1 Tax=Dongia rigui TaxID=940149 RepID=A0ABU5E3Q3_9PROT|nr:VPLPA-CTERM sorting domain-containing protein [Dongia rigui]MDY0874210.1 VPLPA-CTERM sorting domain-containing protein [Dongia rigui]
MIRQYLRTLLVAIMVLGSFVLLSPAVNAATLDFESLGAPGAPAKIADGYGDLQWNNFYVVDGHRYDADFPNNGYITGASSGIYVGLNGFGEAASLSSSSTFDFISASLTAAFNEGLQLDIAGFRNGAQLYAQTVTLTTQMYATLLFNWTGIDELTFVSYGGKPVYGVSGRQFALDDLNVVQTPLPAALPFLATGLIGLGFAARRRRAAAKAA